MLIVNLWLGFPYMFLVCTGALQAIPEDVNEAATVDGAKPWAIFRLIKLPLLLVTLAPLLIASFAFNFNNFNLIYMLTNGGPRDANVPIPVGFTDILISMVYKVAFTGQTRDYGLASAFTIIIFIIVAVDRDRQFPQDQGAGGAQLMNAQIAVPGTDVGLTEALILEADAAAARLAATCAARQPAPPVQLRSLVRRDRLAPPRRRRS